MSDADILKLAFVGCGAIARYHLNGIKKHAPEIKVTAAIDTAREKAELITAETGAKIYTSLEEGLAEGDFDAVDLMLPHDLHESAAIQTLEAGKHLVLEKPIAPTLEACDRIFAAAKKAGTKFMVAENTQYWPEIVKAQEMIQKGMIGEVITARAAYEMEFNDYWFKDKKPWRYDKMRTGGGIVVDGGAHWIRPLRMWMGEIDEVIGVLDYPLEEMEGESMAKAVFRFQSGKIASFEAMLAKTIMGPSTWFRITGTKGEIHIEGGLVGSIILYDADNREGKKIMEAQGYPQSFGPELKDFARAVLEGKPLEAGPEQAYGELRTALALYRSAESGHWEKVWD